jgi:hypothetical protein
MGKLYEVIEGRLAEFIRAQPVYFIATAPRGAGGHVNVSPKGGLGTLTLLGPRSVAYLDYTGSGVETIAHLRDNGRITVMFCAFSGPPKILRLYGRGEPVLAGDPRFPELLDRFAVASTHGVRSVVVVEVDRIADSCGYGVPLMDYVGDRSLLSDWQHRKSPAELAAYWTGRNGASIDGLPGLAGSATG